MINDRFCVTFAGVTKGKADWEISVRLFPDPTGLKTTEEMYDKSCRPLAAKTFTARGATQARAFASALGAVAEYVVECDEAAKNSRKLSG